MMDHDTNNIHILAKMDLEIFRTKNDREKEIMALLKKINLRSDDLKRETLKCLKLAESKQNKVINLTNIKVIKKSNHLYFIRKNKKVIWLMRLAIIGLLLGLIGASYTIYLINNACKENIRYDLHGFGFRILNIDINNDCIPVVNITQIGARVPQVNIDYCGNQNAVFNIAGADGNAKFNLMNQMEGDRCILNCDLTGDGWPDLNIDLTGDGTCDLNCDTTGDGVADLNIDFNCSARCGLRCDTTGDSRCNFRCTEPWPKMNLDLTGDGYCDVNCDLRNIGVCDYNCTAGVPGYDQWMSGDMGRPPGVHNPSIPMPEPCINCLDNSGSCTLNCDLTGDGVCDFNCDATGNGICNWNCYELGKTPEDGPQHCRLNCDLTGDGVCDFNCDTTGSGACDCNCYLPGDFSQGCILNCNQSCGVYRPVDRPQRPPIITTRVPNTTTLRPVITTTRMPEAHLRIIGGEVVNISNILPDNQPGAFNQVVPFKEFAVENTSSVSLHYQLVFIVHQNNFMTSNLQYRIIATNGGFTSNWQAVPTATITINQQIVIPPRVTQFYRVEFNLVGTGEPQDIDQGRIFSGQFQIIAS